MGQAFHRLCAIGIVKQVCVYFDRDMFRQISNAGFFRLASLKDVCLPY
jgi:hypothetical protein